MKLCIHVTGTLLFHMCIIIASPSLYFNLNLDYVISFLPGSTEQLLMYLFSKQPLRVFYGLHTVLGLEMPLRTLHLRSAVDRVLESNR